jgi:glycine hydroxymethyltransferase
MIPPSKKTDPKIWQLIQNEEERQQVELQLIPSENYVSRAVREALGSVLSNKYSEGYPGKRYYQGNKYVDEIETLAVERAKKLFGVPHANVQPLSGAPANLAVLSALCEVGDAILSQHLYMGGHLSMGQSASVTSKYYRASYYGLTKEGDVNWGELEREADNSHPKIIFCGGTAFTRLFDFEKYAKIADKVGAYFVADIAHIAGLVAGGVHPSPSKWAHVITTTTHKTLRGPRGGVIMVTEKGLSKNPDLAEKIDRAVFPGLQGGPHNNSIAALAVALAEAGTDKFQKYTVQIIKNSQALARELSGYGFTLVGGGTENHLLWIDLTNKDIDGWVAAWALEAAGIIGNRQTIPFDPRSPYYPSGLRLGTPAVTTRGMKEPEMKQIGKWITEVVEMVRKMDRGEIGNPDKERDREARRKFRTILLENRELKRIKQEVAKFCQKFPIP